MNEVEFYFWYLMFVFILLVPSLQKHLLLCGQWDSQSLEAGYWSCYGLPFVAEHSNPCFHSCHAENLSSKTNVVWNQVRPFWNLISTLLLLRKSNSQAMWKPHIHPCNGVIQVLPPWAVMGRLVAVWSLVDPEAAVRVLCFFCFLWRIRPPQTDNSVVSAIGCSLSVIAM